MWKRGAMRGQGVRAALALAVGVVVAVMVVVITANYRGRSPEPELGESESGELFEEVVAPVVEGEQEEDGADWAVKYEEEEGLRDAPAAVESQDELQAQKEEEIFVARQEERRAREEEMMRLREDVQRAREAYERDLLAQDEAELEEDDDEGWVDDDEVEFDDEEDEDEEELDDEEESAPSPLEEKEARLEYAEDFVEEPVEAFDELEMVDDFDEFEALTVEELAEEFAAADAAQASAQEAFFAYQEALDDLASQDVQEMAISSGVAMGQAQQVMRWLMAELSGGGPAVVSQPASAPPEPHDEADEPDEEEPSPWVKTAWGAREIQEAHFPELAALADQVEEAAAELDPDLSEEEQHQELMDFYEALEELMEAMLGDGPSVSDART